ncbi:MAG: glycosyltransferase [DPANN group archaeon]|nr:glycosyltransferase [DPANN group archaeon]
MSYGSPELSIIIPTLNEERYLPKLLEVLKRQTFRDYEVIVADSDSKDKTCIIAEGYGAKVLNIARKGPGHGRNSGAKIAKGRSLLFLDADVLLPHDDFLEKFLCEVKSKKLRIANCFHFLYPFNVKDIPANIVLNLYFKAYSYINPITPGFFIYVDVALFNMVGGFDEGLYVAEDVDFVRRAYKYSEFRMINTYIYFSNRRFEKEGRLKLYTKYIYLNSREVLPKYLANIKIDYNFGHYGDLSDDRKYNFLMNKINYFFEDNNNLINEIISIRLKSVKKTKEKIVELINQIMHI